MLAFKQCFLRFSLCFISLFVVIYQYSDQIFPLVNNNSKKPHERQPQLLWHSSFEEDLTQLNLNSAQASQGMHISSSHQLAHLYRIACRLRMKQPAKVIFVGTSNTDGRNFPYFTSLIKEWLAEVFPTTSPHTVFVNGKSGASPCTITHRFGGFNELRKLLEDGTIDLVIAEYDIVSSANYLDCLEADYRLLLDYNVSILFLDLSTPYCGFRKNLLPSPQGCNITQNRDFIKWSAFEGLSEKYLPHRPFYRCFDVPFVSLYDLVKPLSHLPLWSLPEVGNCVVNSSAQAIVAGDYNGPMGTIHTGGRGNKLAALLIKRAIATAMTLVGDTCGASFPSIVAPNLYFAHPSIIYGLMEGADYEMVDQKPVFQGSGWAKCSSPWPVVCSPRGLIHMMHGRFSEWFNSSVSRGDNNSLVLDVQIPIAHIPRYGWSLGIKFQRSNYMYFGPFTALIHHNGKLSSKIVNGSWAESTRLQSETLLVGVSDTETSTARVTIIPFSNETQIVLTSFELFPSPKLL